MPVAEPYAKRTAQGLILGPDGEKMSKSKGNVIDPLDVVDEFGADVLRTYVLFMGDYEKAAPWSENGVKGCKRFLDRVINLLDTVQDGDTFSPALEGAFHRTIRKVSEDIESMKFNTALAALMTLLNQITDGGSINRAEYTTLLKLLSPFAPHLAEELWSQMGEQGMICTAAWPTYDADKCIEASVEIAVQINGKIRARIQIPSDATAEQAIAAAKADGKIAEQLVGMTVIKEFYAAGKLVNLVIKPAQ